MAVLDIGISSLGLMWGGWKGIKVVLFIIDLYTGPEKDRMRMKKACQELAGKKKALYAEYRKAQADMRQAVAVKANIEHLLGVTDGRENKAQER